MDSTIDLTKKVVVLDGAGPTAKNNLCFHQNDPWYRFSGKHYYKACLDRGFQPITADIYLSLEKKPKAICMRDSTGGPNYTKLFERMGLPLAVLAGPEQPMYSCFFFLES